ncbi:hypothetical protein FHS29_005169 [Saccharothrix tamanrassetensis]|uniref:Tetratricopeptide repeat protein n=1 Tax=Saccharothrix tamanrassetensis TaxID=1051531 RepID=A0A841CLW8_9PSEU|nr:hypothetical protein [Saccharothrix tamanrassetensis]MBB5958561.1 hypothetical protein [Saccharothrix tamanrassetensis]
MEIAEDIEATAREVTVRIHLGHQLVTAGEPREAAEVWRRAHALAVRLQDPATHEIEALLEAAPAGNR